MNGDLRDALGVALRAVDASGALIRGARRRRQEVFLKSDSSVVTETDRQVELALREVISKAYPSHGFLGEEHGACNAGGRWCWLIDPIDGTVSFVNGLPFAATLVALCHDGQPVVSVVDFPEGDRAWAVKGQGAWVGERRLRVCHGFDRQRSVVCHGDSYTFELAGYAREYRALEQHCQHFRSYTDAFGHYLVAAGQAAAVVDAAMEKWDVAAVRLLVEEAGGEVLCLPDRHDEGRCVLLSGAPRAVAELADCLGIARSGSGAGARRGRGSNEVEYFRTTENES